MIKTEIMPNGNIKTYSDEGYYIHGGMPASDYAIAIDPPNTGRTYVETDRKIEPEDEPTESDYATAGHILIGDGTG